jgi:sulfate-transporting ATPase
MEKTVYDVVSGGNDLIEVGNTSVNAGLPQSLQLCRCGSAKESGDAVRRRAQPPPTGHDPAEGGNVLLLDEPTNDIDVNTLRALEDALDNFAGCVLVISHDRWFIDRLATHILAFEDEAEVVFFEGNYSQYEAKKKEERGM